VAERQRPVSGRALDTTVRYVSRPGSASLGVPVDLDETEHAEVIVRGPVRLRDEAEVGIPPLRESRLAEAGCTGVGKGCSGDLIAYPGLIAGKP
jgi:hypothetical protein